MVNQGNPKMLEFGFLMIVRSHLLAHPAPHEGSRPVYDAKEPAYVRVRVGARVASYGAQTPPPGRSRRTARPNAVTKSSWAPVRNAP